MSTRSPKTGRLHALGEAAAFLRAGLGALLTGWPNRRRQQEIDAPATPIAEPGDPAPVLKALEQLKQKAGTSGPPP